MKKVDEVIARGEKCIMFTQFLKVIHYLEEEFERKGINVLTIEGYMNVQTREKKIE